MSPRHDPEVQSDAVLSDEEGDLASEQVSDAEAQANSDAVAQAVAYVASLTLRENQPALPTNASAYEEVD